MVTVNLLDYAKWCDAIFWPVAGSISDSFIEEFKDNGMNVEFVRIVDNNKQYQLLVQMSEEDYIKFLLLWG